MVIHSWEVIYVKTFKKAAIISTLVLMISIVPAFALNNTNITNETQDQNQTQTQAQAQDGTGQNCQGNCQGQTSCTCDGKQHQCMYGPQNDNAGADNGNCDMNQHKYQYGKNTE